MGYWPSRELALPFATGAELLLASEKDSGYHKRIVDQLLDAAAALQGPGGRRAALLMWLSEAEPILRAATILAYRGLTTGVGRATPGEQHCDISLARLTGLPVGGLQCALGVSLHALVPVGGKWLKTIAAWLVLAARRREGTGNLQWELVHWLGAKLGSDKLGKLLAEAHFGLFLMCGKFVHLSSRLTGLRAVRLSLHSPSAAAYAPLGVLVLLRLALRALTTFRRARVARAAEESCASARITHGDQRRVNGTRHRGGCGSSGRDCIRIHCSHCSHGGEGRKRGHCSESEAALTCSLCLSPRWAPAITACGHVFCWDCLQEWLADKSECPLCRQPTSPQSVRCMHGHGSWS